MICAEFFKKSGEIIGFKVNGHAGYDEYGRDIACASVSSAVQLTANLITETFGFDAVVDVFEDTVSLKTETHGDKILQGLYDGFVMHLELLSQEFEGTIKIEFTEV